ncbi:MAG: NAD(P)/FAD-dependent oxidoreductase [Dehalococcoidales bacterium]|nr:MAG: NAD(P)/FAD-dependent oxidoreductase [Dehalococcoidales bacterium]
MHDVAVVGGGPAGSHVAGRLVKLGYDVAVLERKQYLSEPVCCTGIISRECTTTFAIDEDLIFRWANGARIISPSGEVVKLWRPEPQAAIVDRVSFNISLASRAQGRGARYLMGTQVRAVKVQDDRVVIEAGCDGEPLSIEARVAVIATGFSLGFVEGLGLGRISDSVPGIQVEVAAPTIDDVEVYCGREVAPGFFGWLVPTSPGRALVGLLARRSLGTYLEKLMSSLEAQGKIMAANSEPMHWGIPLKPLPKTYGQRLMVVGTAAGQVKPTTGGGIYYGLLCADIAADHLDRALAADDLSARSLARYEREWKKKLGRELRVGYWARKVYERLNDGQIEKIFDIMQSSGILEDLLKDEDLSFDWHGGVVSRVFNYRVFLKTIAAMNLPTGLIKRLTSWGRGGG